MGQVRFTIDLNEVIASDLKFLASQTACPGESSGVSVARFVTELVEAEVASRRLAWVIPGVGDPPILTLEALRARPAELPEDFGENHANEHTCTENGSCLTKCVAE
jgi:hypothetical protein